MLLISIDTLRPDRLGCYGASQVETPAIDALARSGVRFENAFTPVPLTLPAHWTLLTGVEPWHHGVIDNGMTLAAPPAATLAERFAVAGYDTAAFVSAFVLHRTFGLDRGFAHYDDGPAADAALDQLLHATGRADERVDRALAWLRRERTRPFFLWLHLFDPHAPYDPPEDFRARHAGRPYDGEVAFVDTQVARLLAALDRSGAAGDTLVVLVSDHGESLGEHGEQTHGILLYDATLRVPLIVRLPGRLPAGEVRREPATLADVAPTVLALAGLAAAPPLDGRDLFGAAGPPRHLAAISEAPHRRLGWGTLVALRDAGWKYIAGPRPELYAIDQDPQETEDRIGSEAARAVPLARAAREVERAMRRQLAARPAGEPKREDQARLAALGYVSGPRSPAASLPAPPDPKDVIASLQRWGKRDAMGSALMQFVQRMDSPAPDTFRIFLGEACGFVLEALGKPSSNVPFIMPKRIADTDPFKQIEEHIGSGPFVFKRDEWKPGDKAVYVKFDRYKPRPEPASGLAGGGGARAAC